MNSYQFNSCWYETLHWYHKQIHEVALVAVVPFLQAREARESFLALLTILVRKQLLSRLQKVTGTSSYQCESHECPGATGDLLLFSAE